MGELYMACGVIEDKGHIVAYRLMRSDGKIKISDIKETERLIEIGEINNLRLQNYKDTRIIRGKGININNLKVYSKEDIKTEEKKRYSIKRKVVKNGKRVGYELEDDKGAVKILNTRDVYNKITNGEVINAEIKVCTVNGKERPAISGIGININTIDEIIIGNNGIVNTENIWENSFRSYRTKSSGIVRNEIDNKLQRFRAGDILAYCINARIYILDGDTEIEKIDRDIDSDMNLYKCGNYTVEFSSGNRYRLNKEIILKWDGAILKR